MAHHWEIREKMIAGRGSQGMSGHVCWYFAVLFAVLGIIGDAANITLGLESMSWFLLAIVGFLASITFFIGWAVSWYLETETKKKELPLSKPPPPLLLR